MKRFNEIITLQVEVDTIADKLLTSLDRENPHAELIAETTVGLLLHRGGLGMLYQSLNGWKLEINIEVGTKYLIPVKTLTLVRYDTERNQTNLQLSVDDMIEVTAKEVQPYRDSREKILVTVQYYRESYPEIYTAEVWVNHLNLKAFDPEMAPNERVIL